MTEGPLRAGTTGPWRQRGVSFWLSQPLILTGGWWMSHSSLTLSLPFGKSKSSPLWWHRALCDLAPPVPCPHLPRPRSLSNPWVALLFLRSVRPCLSLRSPLPGHFRVLDWNRNACFTLSQPPSRPSTFSNFLK